MFFGMLQCLNVLSKIQGAYMSKECDRIPTRRDVKVASCEDRTRNLKTVDYDGLLEI